MLQNIKAVLFDLDGTLVDSMWVWKQIDLDYLGSRNIRMPESLQKDIEGMSMRETAKFFQQQFAITDSIDVMIDVYKRQIVFRLRRVLSKRIYVKKAMQ